jgi:hypothetical protein
VTDCQDSCLLDRRCEQYRDCEIEAPPLWDILITSIPHRHELLCGLLAELSCQREALFGPDADGSKVGALLYRDNLELPYGDKTGVLMRASRAQYVSCIDDDDLPGPGYMSWIWAALASRPDYVGYPVRWTRDGVAQLRIEHSLRHGGWGADDGLLKRDLSEKNPIRRELALLGSWSGGYEAEARWAAEVRATGRVRTEAWIPEPVYWYRESTADTFQTPRQPFPGLLPELPSYPWLMVIGS